MKARLLIPLHMDEYIFLTYMNDHNDNLFVRIINFYNEPKFINYCDND